jgi:cytoskeletal protein CcmA (bactofilin family)
MRGGGDVLDEQTGADTGLEGAVGDGTTVDRSSREDHAYESVIGEGTTVEGTFRSEHPIRIHGTVRGQVESTQRVVVEAHAKVAAKIRAQEVTIDGDVDGEVTCPGRVEITSAGHVVGEIIARVMVIDEGAYFQGHLEMSTNGRDGGHAREASSSSNGAAYSWRQPAPVGVRDPSAGDGATAGRAGDAVGGDRWQGGG